MPEGPDLLHEPLPLSRSILWKPVTASGAGALIPDPICVTQAVIVALRDHAGTAPQQTVLGFLTGYLCQSSEPETRYILVNATILATQPVQGDRTTIVLKALWERVRAEVRKSGTHLLGWYHTHPALGIELSSYDVETHERYFRDPWHIALVVGAIDGQPAAGVFRTGADDAWAGDCLPFYEVLKDESAAGGGEKKRSYVVWKNYRAYAAGSSGRASGSHAAPHIPAPPVPHPAAWEEPEEEAEESEETEELEQTEEPAEREETAEAEDPGELRFLSAADDVAPPPRAAPPRPPTPAPRPPPPPPLLPPPRREPRRSSGAERSPEPAPARPPVRRAARRSAPRRAGRRRWGRIVVLGVILLFVPAGGALYWRFAPGRRDTAKLSPPPRHRSPRGIAPPATPVIALLDRLADSLGQAVANYDDRRRLFDKRQLDCLALGRGLVAVERRVAAYDVQHAVTRATLDPGRAARDQALRASVDSVERRFQRSRCQRP